MNIKKISLIKFKCEKCGKRADYIVELINDDSYSTKIETYCEKHLPKKAKRMWDEEIKY